MTNRRARDYWYLILFTLGLLLFFASIGAAVHGVK